MRYDTHTHTHTHTHTYTVYIYIYIYIYPTFKIYPVIRHSRSPEDGNHMPKHVGVEFGTY
jgi:hypothetical protein